MYVLTDPDQVEAVRSVLAATANPQHPNEVSVSRPSDALAAKKAVDATLQALLLGLGGVALLVGGIGIANMMVVAVLERRTEIGVRRALGATKRHIRLQFLVEAVLLALLGGVLGVMIGVGVTAGYTTVRNMVLSVPVTTVAAGVAPRSWSARSPAVAGRTRGPPQPRRRSATSLSKGGAPSPARPTGLAH